MRFTEIDLLLWLVTFSQEFPAQHLLFSSRKKLFLKPNSNLADVIDKTYRVIKQYFW